MRKVMFVVVMVLTVTLAFGQKNVRQTASNYLKAGKLDLALESINQCIQDPTTIQDAKSWFLRGNIYLEIANTDKPEYKALDADPLTKALDSYKKAIEYDSKKEFYQDIVAKLDWQRNNYYNAAVDAYTKKNYKDAMTNFANGADVIAIAGIADTSSLLNAAYCASLANEPAAAKKYYLDLLKGNYQSPALYMSLSDVYRQEKDSVNALKYVREGIQKYPGDLRLFLAETNIYLTFEDTEKAMRNLRTAIEKDPSNPTIYFALGTIYDRITNDTAQKADVQQTAFTEAVNSYEKAISLNPEYFDATYNLGALYVNKAATIMDQANRLPFDQSDKFEVLKKEAEGFLTKAAPYLEKASELDPNDLNTLYSLKQIFARTGQTEKLKAVNEKIAKLAQ